MVEPPKHFPTLLPPFVYALMGVDIRVLEAIVRMLDGDSEALLSYKPKPRLSIRSNDLYSSEESSLFSGRYVSRPNRSNVGSRIKAVRFVNDFEDMT